MSRLVVFASTILLATPVAAQPPYPADSAPDSTQSVAVLQDLLAGMRPGSMLMVRLTDDRSLEGRLVPSRGLELLRSGSLDSVTVDLGSVDTLWEERISKRKGMTIGGIIGGVVGATALTSLVFLWDTGRSEVNDAEIATVTILFGGAVGTTIGAILGGVTSSGSPTWTQRYPTDRVRPSPWTHASPAR